MKQPKKLTRDQKIYLTKKGFDPDLYRFVDEKKGISYYYNTDNSKYLVVDKANGKLTETDNI